MLLLLVGAISGAVACSDDDPCLVGPCAPSAEAPCGLDEGCVYGECDALYDHPYPVELCTVADGQGGTRDEERYCNTQEGRYAGGSFCDSFHIDAGR